MNTFEMLFSRKSVRSYTGEEITDEQLQLILKAANAAPIAMAQYDSVHLTVITDTELQNEINEACAEVFHRPDFKPLYDAPTFIVVSSKGEGNESYSNTAIMVHNMAIAATELGIGSCYIWGAVIAINAKPELVAKLNLPEGFVPRCGIALGVTDEKYTEREIDKNRISLNRI